MIDVEMSQCIAARLGTHEVLTSFLHSELCSGVFSIVTIGSRECECRLTGFSFYI